MIVNGSALLATAPIKGMVPTKIASKGLTYGLGEAGYDIRLAQDIEFLNTTNGRTVRWYQDDRNHGYQVGRFVLASAMEEFEMPENLVGIVHDKSSNARRGLSVFNTVIEPGWKGFLTLELVYHGEGHLFLEKGTPIAQVVFHETAVPACYAGRYQNQPNEPVAAKAAIEKDAEQC